jgi:HEPN domain-containing protein
VEIAKHELEALSQARRQEAVALFRARQYSGAYYLAGYAVELAIKACIAKRFRAGVIPDRRVVQSVYSHDLEALIGVAGLRDELDTDLRASLAFRNAWGAVRDWNEQSRYAVWDATEAEHLIKAVGDDNNGVLQWLRARY